MFEKLKELFKAQHDAHDATGREIKRLYSIGSIVHFTRGEAIVMAEVLATHSWGYEHRLQVRNIRTLKEYWITITSYDTPEVVEFPRDEKPFNG